MRAQDGPLKPCEFGGTTALVALRIGEVLYVAHAGDSRAVLASDRKALRLTADHKPDRPDECARVWVRRRLEHLLVPCPLHVCQQKLTPAEYASNNCACAQVRAHAQYYACGYEQARDPISSESCTGL